MATTTLKLVSRNILSRTCFWGSTFKKWNGWGPPYRSIKNGITLLVEPNENMVTVWMYKARDGLSRTTLRFYQGMLWNWGLYADKSYKIRFYFLVTLSKSLCHWNLSSSNITKYYSLQTAGKKINHSQEQQNDYQYTSIIPREIKLPLLWKQMPTVKVKVKWIFLRSLEDTKM